ncbi:MAG: hypothetical protein DHS20C18_42660 [Saprospiraceae bacterium]|nr:MAG: hypothetical protein DHS20C18_42660 [Saprospiraceae bacterium]
MSFFDRIANGWKIGWTSLKTIKENGALMLFPIMSGIAMIAVLISFMSSFFILSGVEGLESFGHWIEQSEGGSDIVAYIGLFVFYLINFFTIVFFNVGLVYCARQIFEGKEPSVKEGIQYSITRINAILSWAILAATVGVILKTLEDRLGFVGKLIIGLIGMVWTIATFFVVPVIAYENVGPIEAVKRSGTIMKEKWGEAIGANFSFAAFFILGYLAAILLAIGLFAIHPLLAIVAGVLSILFVHTAVSAAKTVFLAAAYQHLHEEPAGHFDQGDVLDDLFMPKKK